MIARCAYVYVRLLLALTVLLFVSSLALHVSVLMGRGELYTRFGQMLFGGTVIVGIPITLFEKNRNFWKNEFKICPSWLRGAVVTFAAYGLGVLFLQLIVFPDEDPFQQAFAVSAIPLSFDSILLCILYAVVWSGSVDESELVRRARNSVIAAALTGVVFLAYRAGYLHHPAK